MPEAETLQMPIATCSSCGAKMKVSGDRVGRFAPCPKCGQTLAIAEHRVEPSAEHSLIPPEPSEAPFDRPTLFRTAARPKECDSSVDWR